ncbi:MAG: carboxypeptidase-like regulatory domain-containing protein, partial [Gemmatimonadaceae bacterium]
SKPGNITALEFVTDEDPGSHLVVRQTTHTTSGTTGRPFVAVREAGEFARQGYMARDSGSLNFFAPDADVLLDQKFAATHCFSIVRDDAGHPNEVGLSFEPSPGGRPDGFVDVDGTLWLQSNHPALRTLDFGYTGLDPAYREAGTGGQLVFRTMPNGLVYIERWEMHLPAMAANAARGQSLPGRAAGNVFPGSLRNVHVVQWRETGGEVLSAQWPDGSHAESSLGVITGIVRDPDGHPLAGVRAGLDGTPTAATTDSTGRFTMSPVVPGRYGLDVLDSTYAPFIDPRRAAQTISVHRDTLNVGAIVLQGRTQAANRLCGDETTTPSHSAVVLGTVTDASGLLARGANVAVSWTYRQPGDPVPRTSGTIKAEPSDDGRFIACHVPFGATLSLRLVRRDSTVADTTLMVGQAAIQRVEWSPAPVRPPKESSSAAQPLQSTDRGRIARRDH